MRLLTALALVLVLASSALAQSQFTDNDDSEHQQQQYGKIFGGVCIGLAALGTLIGGYIVFKGMIAEHSRGKKRSPFREEILDKPAKRPQQELYLGEKVPEWKISGRQKATWAALKFLSETDEKFRGKYMVKVADRAVQLVKESIEARSLKPVLKLVTPKYLDQLRAEIKGLREDGSIHIFGQVEVTGVEIIHLEAPEGKVNHAFVALVSARSKDYLRDEKTGQVLRGDKKLYTYQEFWCFQRVKGRWLLGRVRPAGDMDRILEAKNVLAQADLKEFAKDADEECLREFVAK
jgi:predicted lipid-binding transport protein (Tim44 family)